MNLNNRVKYPHTMHFPWSPGLQNDDRVMDDQSCFNGKTVVVTEKIDGENTTMYLYAIHARSAMDMARHESRDFVKSLWGSICTQIPERWRICGENAYAKHSIHYTVEGGNPLADYFLVYSIWDENNNCLNWNNTEIICKELGLFTVPTWYVGPYNEDFIRYYLPPTDWSKCEGYVVRNAESFPFSEFGSNVAKYVRKGHVQTSEFWLHEVVIKNELGNPCKELSIPS